MAICEKYGSYVAHFVTFNERVSFSEDGQTARVLSVFSNSTKEIPLDPTPFRSSIPRKRAIRLLLESGCIPIVEEGVMKFVSFDIFSSRVFNRSAFAAPESIDQLKETSMELLQHSFALHASSVYPPASEQLDPIQQILFFINRALQNARETSEVFKRSLLEAKVLLAIGNFTKVLEKLGAALNQDRTQLDVKITCAHLLHFQDRRKEALAFYTQLIKEIQDVTDILPQIFDYPELCEQITSSSPFHHRLYLYLHSIDSATAETFYSRANGGASTNELKSFVLLAALSRLDKFQYAEKAAIYTQLLKVLDSNELKQHYQYKLAKAQGTPLPVRPSRQIAVAPKPLAPPPKPSTSATAAPNPQTPQQKPGPAPLLEPSTIEELPPRVPTPIPREPAVPPQPVPPARKVSEVIEQGVLDQMQLLQQMDLQSLSQMATHAPSVVGVAHFYESHRDSLKDTVDEAARKRQCEHEIKIIEDQPHLEEYYSSVRLLICRLYTACQAANNDMVVTVDVSYEKTVVENVASTLFDVVVENLGAIPGVATVAGAAKQGATVLWEARKSGQIERFARLARDPKEASELFELTARILTLAQREKLSSLVSVDKPQGVRKIFAKVMQGVEFLTKDHFTSPIAKDAKVAVLKIVDRVMREEKAFDRAHLPQTLARFVLEEEELKIVATFVHTTPAVPVGEPVREPALAGMTRRGSVTSETIEILERRMKQQLEEQDRKHQEALKEALKKQAEEHQEDLKKQAEESRRQKETLAAVQRQQKELEGKVGAIEVPPTVTGGSQAQAQLSRPAQQRGGQSDISALFQRVTVLEQGLTEVAMSVSFVQDHVGLSGDSNSSLPPTAFGRTMWKQHLKIEVGKEPELPMDIFQILKGPCPFTPGKTVEETHILVLVPEKLGTEPLTLRSLERLVRVKKDQMSIYHNFPEQIKDMLGDRPASRARWVLMTKAEMPNTRNKSYSDQLQLLPKEYEAPSLLDVTTLVVMEFFRTGTRLYGDKSYTRCLEQNGQNQITIGGFSPKGLGVGSSTGAFVGLAASRILTPIFS